MHDSTTVVKNNMKLIAMLAAMGFAQAAHAGSLIDLGVAGNYSGFFFGNVAGAADVEGKLAVGGNLQSGFDIGYRNPYGSTGPSLVVGGNIHFGNGTIYNGPNYKVNTNASIGPSTAQWIPQGKVSLGTAVYGGTADFSNDWGGSNWQKEAFSKQSGVIDFGATRAKLNTLSTQLSGVTANGKVVAENGGLTLVGDGKATLQVFNIGNASISNLSLSNINKGATILINSTASSASFSGGLGGDLAGSTDGLAGFRDRVLFNLPKASTVDVNTFVNGTILALNATVAGSGHIEGITIANNLSTGNGKLELGFESFKPLNPYNPAPAVPEPETWGLMGLGLTGVLLARRRKQGMIG